MSMFSDAQAAHTAGYTVEKCAHCGGWVWWPPESLRAPGCIRVFHCFGPCGIAEGKARAAEGKARAAEAGK